MGLKRAIKGILYIASIAVLMIGVTNLFMVQSYKENIKKDEALKQLQADCIIVLGAGVWENSVPTPILADRLDEGIRLYKAGIAPKILVSGDHGQNNYDEVNVMKAYLIKAGISEKDIFMDHAGFTTYDSMYRARDIFGVKRTIVVTQEYHIYRALYICDKLGLEALGSPAYPNIYPGAKYRTVREWLARDKAILYCLLKPKAKLLGEPIDIHGSGKVTNDK